MLKGKTPCFGKCMERGCNAMTNTQTHNMAYALIGCGRIATNHIRAALKNGLNITSVCDVIPERMEALLTLHGLENERSICRYTNYQELVQKECPQLVAIATDSGSHAKIALHCIEQDMHLIIEKPMAMSIRDADTIIVKSQAKGTIVSACHQNRFNLAVQQLRCALEAGRFGHLSHGSVHVRWNRDRNYYTQAPWRGTWHQDGGCLMNQSIHGIDLLRWMMGDEIEEVMGVTARRQHPYIQAEDIGMAVVRFKSGAIATIEGTTNVYPKNLEETLYLFGEHGTVKLGGKSVNKIDVWEFADKCKQDEEAGGLEEKTHNVYGNGHTSLYADVIHAIETGAQPYVDAIAGRNALELVLAIYLSAQKGQPVKLPLEECASSDFEGMFG